MCDGHIVADLNSTEAIKIAEFMDGHIVADPDSVQFLNTTLVAM